jgi:hypothetical protein
MVCLGRVQGQRTVDRVAAAVVGAVDQDAANAFAHLVSMHAWQREPAGWHPTAHTCARSTPAPRATPGNRRLIASQGTPSMRARRLRGRPRTWRRPGRALARPATRIEAAAPLPFGGRTWVANTLHNRAGVHVAVIDAPAFLRDRTIAAAGEGGHGPIISPNREAATAWAHGRANTHDRLRAIA